MDRDKAREAWKRTKHGEHGTGDALAEGGCTGVIALGVALASQGPGNTTALVAGIVLVALGIALYIARRHYRDQRFS